MITRMKLELEMQEIIDKCETVKQVNMISKAISESLFAIAKQIKRELNELLPKEIEAFFDTPNEFDNNYKSIFDSIRDLEIAIEEM